MKQTFKSIYPLLVHLLKFYRIFNAFNPTFLFYKKNFISLQRIKKLIQPHECMEPNEYLIEDKPIINRKIPVSLSDTFNSLKSSSSYLKKIQSTHSIPNCYKVNTNV